MVNWYCCRLFLKSLVQEILTQLKVLGHIIKSFDIRKSELSELSEIKEAEFEVKGMVLEIENYVTNVTFIKKILEDRMNIKDLRKYCKKYESINNYEA